MTKVPIDCQRAVSDYLIRRLGSATFWATNTVGTPITYLIHGLFSRLDSQI